MTLCLKPDVLIADEPTSALDMISQKEVVDLILKVKKELNISVIFITHDIAVASAISSRVMIMEKGRLLEQGEIKAVFSKWFCQGVLSNWQKNLLRIAEKNLFRLFCQRLFRSVSKK